MRSSWLFIRLWRYSFPTKILIHDHARFRELFARLLARFQSQCFGHEILMKSLFYELIYMVIQEVHNPPESNGLDGAEVVNRYLQSLMNTSKDNVMEPLSTKKRKLSYKMRQGR